MNIQDLKKGQFVKLTTKVFKEDKRDANYKVYAGIISYTTEDKIGFVNAVSTTIYPETNGTYISKVLSHFHIESSIVGSIDT